MDLSVSRFCGHRGDLVCLLAGKRRQALFIQQAAAVAGPVSQLEIRGSSQSKLEYQANLNPKVS